MSVGIAMLTRLMNMKTISKGQKHKILAYAAVMAMSAGFTVLVMVGVEGSAGILRSPSLYTLWVICAGAIGGGVALFAARGWMGQPHAMGWMRAIVGSTAAALIASVIAGTFVLPVYGTFYAPVMLMTSLIAMPLLAIVWYVVFLGAHQLMISRAQEIALSEVKEDKQYASYQLSSLTRANFYERKNR